MAIRIGGAAGDGIASVAETLAKACSRQGLYVYAYNSYQSLIRGGHINMQLRISADKVWSHGDLCHFLVALNMDTIQRHAKEVFPGGGIIYNNEKIKVQPGQIPTHVQDYGVPSSTLALKYGKSPIMQNTVALGVLSYVMNFPFEAVAEIIADTFNKKGDAVVTANVGAAQGGYDYAKENFKKEDFTWNLSKQKRMFLTGNEAIALGAVAGGCKFYSAYPMTPASGILHWLAPKGPKYGIVVKQCEDEIAAMNMAVGAGHVGVRAMTGTSGGGFALMTEAIGLSAMIEAPVVVVNCQRGGPSTGLPTKTEQGDIFQALGASQGDYPKIILAPPTVEDAFYSTAEALNLAEIYQCPVILLSDLLLSEHHETIDDLDFSKIKIERGEMISGPQQNYKRYLDTPTGISPRAVPGNPGTMYVSASDEHDEEGVVISDVFTDPLKRKAMMEKRMRKMESALKNLPDPKLIGPEKADLTFVTWGSTYSVVRDVVHRLENNGIKVNHLNIKYLWPFKAEAVAKILKSCKNTLIVEANYSGQLEKLIRQETGLSIPNHLRKYDGEPFGPAMVEEAAKKLLSQKKEPAMAGR
jgi:2-oxoglutarate ferredoxin oxidoreductase subunit alpha